MEQYAFFYQYRILKQIVLTMNIILLPIRKEHSDKIFNHTKKYEYRKNFPLSGVDRILVYESRGTGMIVGEFDVSGVVSSDKANLWLLTGGVGGISKSQFEEYFRDREMAYAIKIGEVKKYEQGKSLAEFGLRRAPQNYVWIERSQE